MQSILESFGINGYVLLVQTINFIVVLLILKFLLYKPLKKAITQRQQVVQTTVDLKEKLHARELQLKKQEQEILNKARKQAHQIITQTQKQAQIKSQEIITKAKKKKQALIERFELDLQNQKKALKKQVEQKAIELALSALHNVISKNKQLKESVTRQIIESINKSIDS